MQCPQVTTTSTGHADTTVQPLQIGNVFQARGELFTHIRRLQQLLYRIEALPDRLKLNQRIAEPLFQTAGTHSRAGTIQTAEQ